MGVGRPASSSVCYDRRLCLLVRQVPARAPARRRLEHTLGPRKGTWNPCWRVNSVSAAVRSCTRESRLLHEGESAGETVASSIPQSGLLSSVANPLECNGNQSATSNNMELVHSLLHLLQRGGNWAGPQPAQPLLAVPNVTGDPSSSTASVPISVLLYNGLLLGGFNVPIKGLTSASVARQHACRIH